MPKVQGLSKAEANYRKAENPKFSCHECALCSRGWRSADALWDRDDPDGVVTVDAPIHRWIGGASWPWFILRFYATWPLAVLELSGTTLTLRDRFLGSPLQVLTLSLVMLGPYRRTHRLPVPAVCSTSPDRDRHEWRGDLRIRPTWSSIRDPGCTRSSGFPGRSNGAEGFPDAGLVQVAIGTWLRSRHNKQSDSSTDSTSCAFRRNDIRFSAITMALWT